MFGADRLFLRNGIIDVDAAVVGVGSRSWVCIAHSDAQEETAQRIMQCRRFDVLPVNGEDRVTEYFRTETWNDFGKIRREPITHRDVMPARTSIRDVIKGFAETDRVFYFLTDEGWISGLVTIVNLNCRQVKVYLFGLISELETRLGEFIVERVSANDLYELTFGGGLERKHRAVHNRYLRDKKNGVEVPLVEYLYLLDLIEVVDERQLFGVLGYDREKFKTSFCAYNELRNAVAHPTRSIVTSPSCVNDLWGKIDGIEDALFRFQYL